MVLHNLSARRKASAPIPTPTEKGRVDTKDVLAIRNPAVIDNLSRLRETQRNHLIFSWRQEHHGSAPSLLQHQQRLV